MSSTETASIVFHGSVDALKIQRLKLPYPGTLLLAPSFVVRRIDKDVGKEQHPLIVLGYEFSTIKSSPAFRAIFLSDEPSVMTSVLFFEDSVKIFHRWFTQL